MLSHTGCRTGLYRDFTSKAPFSFEDRPDHIARRLERHSGQHLDKPSQRVPRSINPRPGTFLATLPAWYIN